MIRQSSQRREARAIAQEAIVQENHGRAELLGSGQHNLGDHHQLVRAVHADPVPERSPLAARAASTIVPVLPGLDRAHGLAAATQDLGDRILDTASPAAEPAHRLMEVELLYELGRWKEAERVLQGVSSDPTEFRTRALTALLTVRQGDLATARRIDASLAAIDRPYLVSEPTFRRARIAAVRSVGRLASAPGHGFPVAPGRRLHDIPARPR